MFFFYCGLAINKFELKSCLLFCFDADARDRVNRRDVAVGAGARRRAAVLRALQPAGARPAGDALGGPARVVNIQVPYIR